MDQVELGLGIVSVGAAIALCASLLACHPVSHGANAITAAPPTAKAADAGATSATPIRTLKPSFETPTSIDALVATGKSVVVLDRHGRVFRLDLQTSSLQRLSVPSSVALSANGSIAVALFKSGKRGTRVEAWDLGTERLVRSHTFVDGTYGEIAVGTDRVLLRLNDPQQPTTPAMPPMPPASIPLPFGRWALWDPASDELNDRILNDPYGDCHVKFAPSGNSLTCKTHWHLGYIDLERPDRGKHIQIAPEWMPKPTQKSLESRRLGRKPQPDMQPWTNGPTYAWLRDDSQLIVGYSRLAPPDECRLERWRLDAPQVEVQRLVTVHQRCRMDTLAVSSDGHIVVTRESPQGLFVRRAPDYPAESFPVQTVNVAAFALDDARLVTGHTDGRLRVWESRSLALLAALP